MVDNDEGLYAEFETGPIETLLLHGDCHHHNILASDRQPWVIIDPKGLVGDPGFEVGAFLGNPIGIGASPDLARIARRRLDILAEMLERDWEGLRRWSFIMKMLDAWWCVEDNAGEMAEAVRFAEILDDMARR
jgi:streptomycin 6-kinase